MYIYIPTYIPTYIYIHIHIYVCMYTHTHTHIYVYMYIHICSRRHQHSRPQKSQTPGPPWRLRGLQAPRGFQARLQAQSAGCQSHSGAPTHRRARGATPALPRARRLRRLLHVPAPAPALLLLLLLLPLARPPHCPRVAPQSPPACARAERRRVALSAALVALAMRLPGPAAAAARAPEARRLANAPAAVPYQGIWVCISDTHLYNSDTHLYNSDTHLYDSDVCMYVCMYVCVCVCVCMYVCMYVCMCVCMYSYMYVYMYVCVYVCMYVESVS